MVLVVPALILATTAAYVLNRFVERPAQQLSRKWVNLESSAARDGLTDPQPS